MLLVDDRQTQRSEIHRIFNQGVRPDQYAHIARQQSGQNGLAPLAFHRTGQQLHTNIHAIQKTADGVVMLIG